MQLSFYKEDIYKQGDGTPIHIKSQSGTITFYVRRWGTKQSEKALKDIRRALFGPLHKHSEEDALLVQAHWLVEYGVAKWESLIDDDTGKEIPYSKEASRELFTDESYFLSLNSQLIQDAMIFEHYLFEEVEEVIEAIKKP